MAKTMKAVEPIEAIITACRELKTKSTANIIKVAKKALKYVIFPEQLELFGFLNY